MTTGGSARHTLQLLAMVVKPENGGQRLSLCLHQEERGRGCTLRSQGEVEGKLPIEVDVKSNERGALKEYGQKYP